MSTISMMVLLASILCFIIGLINPVVFSRWFGKDINRKRIAMIFGGLMVASFIATSAFASPSKEKPQPKPEAFTQQVSTPKIETKEETKTDDIAFQTENKDDSTLEKGQTQVKQEGKNGTKETKYKVTYTNGKETAREIISEVVTVQPVNKIVLSGTKVTAPVVSSPNQSNTYTNVDGNTIESPSSNQSGATAKCKDGTYSHSQHRSGTCSGHGGVAEWL